MTEPRSEPEPEQYVDDAPKSNPWTEDQLGYAPFAERLARVIRNLHAPNGYVIGLNGVWGSGKTTAIQFIEAHLRKHNEENPEDLIHVVNFKPWLVSGHQDLLSAFFKLLNETLFPVETARHYGAKKWGRRAQRVADPLMKLIATLGSVLEPTGLAHAAVTNLASASFDKYLSAWVEQPSVQSAYQALDAKLRANTRRMLVIIDDIDRLQSEEIRTVMQLVKSVGQLPNVLYLLSYDRDIVWKAVNDSPDGARARPSFAEKIIQHEIELPQPGRDRLLRMFDREARLVLSPIKGQDLRWHHFVHHGLQRWIRHPRSVTRYANALKFTGPALLHEVDSQDLLAIEGLRLFERPVFDWIRTNRDFLVNAGWFVTVSDDDKSALGRRFRESISDTSRDNILMIVCDLFPQAAKYIGERSRYGGDSYHAVLARRGIGVEHGYDAYFSFFPSEFGIPKSVLDEFINRCEDVQWLRRVISDSTQNRDPTGTSLIAELIREINARIAIDERLLVHTQLIEALLAEGEPILLLDESTALFGLPPSSAWLLLIEEILKRWRIERASRDFPKALDATASLSVWTSVYVHLARASGVIPGRDSGMQLISAAALGQIGTQLLPMIQRARDDDSLIASPHYYHVISSWGHLAGAEEPGDWIRGHLGDPSFFSKLSLGFLAYSMDSEGHRTYSLSNEIDKALLIPEQLCEAAQTHLAVAELTSDERRRLEAVVRGLEDTKQR